MVVGSGGAVGLAPARFPEDEGEGPDVQASYRAGRGFQGGLELAGDVLEGGKGGRSLLSSWPQPALGQEERGRAYVAQVLLLGGWRVVAGVDILDVVGVGGVGGQ